MESRRYWVARDRRNGWLAPEASNAAPRLYINRIEAREDYPSLEPVEVILTFAADDPREKLATLEAEVKKRRLQYQYAEAVLHSHRAEPSPDENYDARSALSMCATCLYSSVEDRIEAAEDVLYPGERQRREMERAENGASV